MVIRRPTFFLILLIIAISPFLVPRIIWLINSRATYGTMRFAGKNYSGQIVHNYSVISFYAGRDTIWFNSDDNIIFNVGELVPVRYEQDHPADARVNIFTGIWGDTLVYGAAPVFILLVLFLHPKGVPRKLKFRINAKRPFIQLL